MINLDYFKQENVVHFQLNYHFSSLDMFMPKSQDSVRNFPE